MSNIDLSIGTNVKTKNGKSGKIRSVYERKDNIILVILLKTNSCYVCSYNQLLC